MKPRRTSANRRKGGGRKHLLEVNVRTASLKRQRRSRAGILFWKVSSVVVALGLAGASAWMVGQKFFFKNPEYSLHHLITHLDGVLTREELVALTGLTEGRNIFGIDLEQANQKLAALPEVRSVTVERILPDTIEVGIEGRKPVFLLADAGEEGESFVPGKTFLCDRDGVVIRPAILDDSYLHLPVVKGIALGEAVPGRRLGSSSLETALRLRQALSELPEENFRIRSIDVSLPYAAVVTDSSNAHFTFGTMGSDLPAQLDRLGKLLSHCRDTGRRIEAADLSISRNTPVTFVLTPETRSEKIVPTASSKKPQKRDHP
jgi:cell division protein FtsQ